jgi:hypothetical protein
VCGRIDAILDSLEDERWQQGDAGIAATARISRQARVTSWSDHPQTRSMLR